MSDIEVEERLDQPFGLVLQALLADSGRWLPGLARDSVDRLVAELEVHAGKLRVARSVEVEVTPPTIYPGRCEICIAWKAAENAAFFPELGGVFELVAVGPAQSRLSFEASYEPPAGVLGQLANWALMHRVAEASVQEFVRRTAESLRTRAASISSASARTPQARTVEEETHG
jgi:ribosome-associated toxin RatA of RatAB toxin-antitoxin module